MHPRIILNPTNGTANCSRKDRATWIANMLPQMDKFLDTETRIQYAQAHMDVDITDMEGQNGPAENASTNAERAAEQ